MADEQQCAAVARQQRFEGLHCKQVQMVGGLVQDEQVRFSQQQPGKRDLRPLAAGEHPNRLEHAVAPQVQLRQYSSGDGFGKRGIGHRVLQRGVVQAQCAPVILVEPSHARLGIQPDRAREARAGGGLAPQCPQQRGLAASVFAHQRRARAGGQCKFRSGQQRLFAGGKLSAANGERRLCRDGMGHTQRHADFRQVPRTRFLLQAVQPVFQHLPGVALVQHGVGILVGVQPCFAVSHALGRFFHRCGPLAFLLHRLPKPRLLCAVLIVFELLALPPAFELCLPVVVTAREVGKRAAFYVQNPGAQCPQQRPVVGDEYQRAGVRLEPLAQSGNAVGVQVGGGLIGQQQRRVA